MVVRLRKSTSRGIHVLTRSLHVHPKYWCTEAVQLWTTMYGFLACIHTHATISLPLQLTAKDRFAYPMRYAGSVQSARAMSASALRRCCTELSLRGRCAGPDTLTNSGRRRCSTGVLHSEHESYWCLRELLDPLKATDRCNAMIFNI